jgi:diguanylate cyclase (GGDEF)-like protein
MGLFFIPMNVFPNPFSLLYSLILVGLGPIFSTSVSMVYWARGVPNARYFAIGWLLGHTVSVVDLLRIMAVLPYYSFMEFMFPAALVSSLVFFTVAVIQQAYTYQSQANQDSLTGLANRRHFDQVLDNEWQRNMRHRRPISLIMVDVDYFKGINDKRGHAYGDSCLIRLAGILRKHARRPGELAARYGGEEFMILLPESDAREASTVAEKLRQAVEEEAIPRPVCQIKAVMTVSLGVATITPVVNTDFSYLIELADTALYKAKNLGRNRVCYDKEIGGENDAGLASNPNEATDAF